MAKKTTKKVAKKSSKPAVKKAAKKPTVKKAKPAKSAKPSVKKTKASASFSVGTSLPDFSADATSGGHFRLSDFRGKNIVLYFYPKDATPGCTIEGQDFSRLLPDFQKSNTQVFGISRDTIASHEKFKAKECFGFDLLSDPDETLCSLFDVVKEKNMYGRKVWGIERSTFVIDGDGRLVAEWRGVRVPGHAEEVLAKVRSI